RSNMHINIQKNSIKKPFNSDIPDLIINENRSTRLKQVDIPQSFITDDIQALDVVVIKTEKEQHPLEDSFIPERFKRHTKKITLEDTRKYPNILDYIAANGFRIIYGTGFEAFGGGGSPRVDIVPILKTSAGGLQGPEVYVDDFRLSDYELLFNLQSADIDRILIDKRGDISGLRSSGTILIYTRKLPLYGFRGDKNSKYILEHAVDSGFETTKEFYNPKYPDFASRLFKQYGTIHWLPDLYIDQGSGAATFKIPDLPVKDMKFFVEGMGSDGSLISKEVTLKNIDSN
ncbi:hypothetical protein M0D21_22905, partial [Aquimarina sp. D1M17]|uniref:hypothetical protein n=1 Tax=Aquimarina acroporae TaxID=2937283 RepID=UPI0020C1783E